MGRNVKINQLPDDLSLCPTFLGSTQSEELKTERDTNAHLETVTRNMEQAVKDLQQRLGTPNTCPAGQQKANPETRIQGRSLPGYWVVMGLDNSQFKANCPGITPDNPDLIHHFCLECFHISKRIRSQCIHSFLLDFGPFLLDWIKSACPLPAA